MENLGYYNGTYAPLEEMQVPMLDRVCYFGDGVYDATCCANHVIFAIDEHIDRFFNSARLLEMNIPYTKAELKNILNEMVQKVDSPTQFVYWQLTRGTGIRDHAFKKDMPGNLWIMLKPADIKDMYTPIKLISAEDTRFFHCNIKTLNLIPSVMATERAVDAGCYECVLHRGERVTECAHSNAHILQNGVLRTAPTDNLILPGIARAHLIRMCAKLGITVDETPYTMDDLRAADEVLVSSSSAFCMRAYELDGKPVGGKAGDTVRKLQDALLKEFKEYTGIA